MNDSRHDKKATTVRCEELGITVVIEQTQDMVSVTYTQDADSPAQTEVQSNTTGAAPLRVYANRVTITGLNVMPAFEALAEDETVKQRLEVLRGRRCLLVHQGIARVVRVAGRYVLIDARGHWIFSDAEEEVVVAWARKGGMTVVP